MTEPLVTLSHGARERASARARERERERARESDQWREKDIIGKAGLKTLLV